MGKLPDKLNKGKERAKSGKGMVLRAFFASTLLVNVLLILALGLLVFVRIPYFALERIEITGNQNLSDQTVIEASGVKLGANLLLLDLAQMSRKLEQRPRISSASVYRRFPGKLLIDVQERAPRAILSAERLYYVDKEGRVFTRVLPGDPVDYPLITGVSAKDLKTRENQVIDMTHRALGVLKVMERLSLSRGEFNAIELRIDLNHGITVINRDGKEIILGKAAYQEKLTRLSKLRKFLESRGKWRAAGIIDLDYEDRALVRAVNDRG
jgi:cell division protein FtsQ